TLTVTILIQDVEDPSVVPRRYLINHFLEIFEVNTVCFVTGFFIKFDDHASELRIQRFLDVVQRFHVTYQLRERLLAVAYHSPPDTQVMLRMISPNSRF